MRLNEGLIENIGKRLQTGCPAKWAAMAEGLPERTFYLWKAEGEQIAKNIMDDDGERDEKAFEKLKDVQKLKLQFFQSIQRSIAEGHSILSAAIYGKIADDWKAALEILSRRFPKEWAKRDQLHIDQEITEKPNKLKEIEEEVFEGIPTKDRKAVIENMQEVIEKAKNGKAPRKAKGKSKASS